MKKSTLSMTSLICGITASILGVLLFPLSIAAKSTNSFTFIGFIGFMVFGAALVGIITSCVKLMTTNSIDEQDINDRNIAWKGFWFSLSPLLLWMFIMILGAIGSALK